MFWSELFGQEVDEGVDEESEHDGEFENNVNAQVAATAALTGAADDRAETGQEDDDEITLLPSTRTPVPLLPGRGHQRRGGAPFAAAGAARTAAAPRSRAAPRLLSGEPLPGPQPRLAQVGRPPQQQLELAQRRRMRRSTLRGSRV